MFVGGVTSAVTAGGATRSAVDVVHVMRRRQGEGLSLAYDGSLFSGMGAGRRRELAAQGPEAGQVCRSLLVSLRAVVAGMIWFRPGRRGARRFAIAIQSMRLLIPLYALVTGDPFEMDCELWVGPHIVL